MAQAGGVRGARVHAAAAVGALLVAAWVAAPRPSRLRDHIVGDAGDAMWQLSVLRWTDEALRSFELPWTPPMFFPTPDTYAYSDPMLTQAAAAAPIRALGAGPALASNLLVAGSWAAAVYLAWRLLRRLTGHGGVAFAGAVAWACSDLRVATVPLFQIVTAGALVPLAFERLLVTLGRPTLVRGLVLGLTLAAAALAALYYGPLFAVTGAVAVLVWFVVARQRPTRAHVAAGAVAGAVVAVLLVPIALRYQDVHDRDGLERVAEDQFSARPSDLTKVSSHHGRLDALPLLEAAATGERALFPGLLVVLAVPVGLVVLVRRWRDGATAEQRRAELAALAAAGLVAYVLATGTPAIGGIRAPARFALLGHLALVALATTVVAAALRRLPRRVEVLAVPLLVALSLVDAGTWLPTVPVPDERRWSAVNEELARRPEGPVAELPVMRSSDGVAWPRVEAPRLYLARIDGNRRVNGYSGYQPPGFDQLASTLNTFPSPEALVELRRMGVRYVVLRTQVVGQRTRDPAAVLPVYGTTDAGRLAVTPQRLRAIRAGLPPGVEDLGTFGGAVLLAVGS